MKKRIYLLLVTCLMMAAGMTSCSKDSDNDGAVSNGAEKTYADDDFLLTERNIKEKLIGTWEISKLSTYSKSTGWITKTAADLGELGTMRLNADGSGELLGLDGVHWRVGKDTLVISSMFITVQTKIENTTTTMHLPLYVNDKYGYTRETILSELRESYSEDKYNIEMYEYKRMKVNRMEKDFFDLREIGKSMGDICELRRK